MGEYAVRGGGTLYVPERAREYPENGEYVVLGV